MEIPFSPISNRDKYNEMIRKFIYFILNRYALNITLNINILIDANKYQFLLY